MKKRSLFLFLAAGLASVLLFAVSAPAEAGSIVVTDSSGGGTAQVDGNAAGALITNVNVLTTEINGVNVMIGTAMSSFQVNVSGGQTVFSGTGVETVGTTAGQQAVLDFRINDGVLHKSHFNLDGVVTKVVANSLPGYNFSQMAGGPISLALDKTGTDFSTVVNGSAKVENTGFGFQQSVPEPTSLALLGIGMSGFFAFRRFFKRTSVA